MNTVLFVDDEESTLASVDSLFHDRDVKVLRANHAEDAMEIIKQEEVAVVVSDNLMPGMKGTKLLNAIKNISPHTFRILMTSYTDIDVAVDAINSGEVFRFIIKPWQNDLLINAVQEALDQYNIIQTLKSSDESRLLSLSEAIELKDGYTKGHCGRVADYAITMASELHLSDDSMRAIRHGSWLHDCGKIGVPKEILNKKGPLDPDEFEVIKNHPKWGADIADKASMSHVVLNIILHHHERYDGTGYPSGLKASEIPFEARIVTVADVFDALTTNRPYREKYGIEKTLNIMSVMRGSAFDPDILDLFMDTCVKVSN